MKEPRLHHVTTASYLRGFAKTGSPDQIFVYDKNSESGVYLTSVLKAARIRDYHRYDNDGGVDPNIIEKGFSALESVAVPVIKKILKHEEIADQERAYVAEFMAAQYLHGPNTLQMLAELRGVQTMFTMDLALASEERFQAMTRGMATKGIEPPNPDSYQRLKNFHDSRAYTLSFQHQDIMGKALLHIRTVAELLFNKNWTFMDAPAGENFLTSDTPLTYRNPDPPSRMFGDGGLENPRSEILFPLSKKCVLLATGKRVPPRMVVTKEMCDIINHNTIIQAHQKIYSSYQSEHIRKLAANSKTASRRLRGPTVPDVRIERPKAKADLGSS